MQFLLEINRTFSNTNQIKGVGTVGGPPIEDNFNILSKPPIIASILLKSIAILLFGF
jgi:hypothetical protein